MLKQNKIIPCIRPLSVLWQRLSARRFQINANTYSANNQIQNTPTKPTKNQVAECVCVRCARHDMTRDQEQNKQTNKQPHSCRAALTH